MTKRLLIKGARVLCPANRIDSTMDILLESEKIKDVGLNLNVTENVMTIDASGLILAPGFIDLHCHLREPGFEHKETVKSGSAAAIKGGFTTICAMPNTHPVTDDATSIQFLLDKAKVQPARVLPIGSATKNSEGNYSQKTLSFLALAEIKLKQEQFILAKEKYDSVVYYIKKEHKKYLEIKNIHIKLRELTHHLQTILYEDSVQTLAGLPENELQIVINTIIQREIEKEREKRNLQLEKQQNTFKGSRYEQEN